MEILFEVLLWILNAVGELLLELVFQALVEFGIHAAKEPFRLPVQNPVVAAIGYLIFGAIAGAISLWFFPAHFITSVIGRIVNILLAPLAAGGVAAVFGMWRRGRGDELLRIDRFAYGFMFAVAMALVRLMFANG